MKNEIDFTVARLEWSEEQQQLRQYHVICSLYPKMYDISFINLYYTR